MQSIFGGYVLNNVVCTSGFIHSVRNFRRVLVESVLLGYVDSPTVREETPADFASHHSEDIPEQHVDRKMRMYTELLVQIVLPSSICPIVLPGCPDPLLPTWMSLILFSSCWFSLMSPPDASACRNTICSSSLFSGTLSTSPAPRSTRALFLSFTRSVSAILSLYAFILAFPVKELSISF